MSVPLWQRQEFSFMGVENQNYSIDSAQKEYEKNRNIREQEEHERELLDMLAVIKPQIITEKGADELEKERKYIKMNILGKRYKRENPDDICTPNYETLKRRYFKQDSHGLHVCEDYEHMNTGEKFLFFGRFYVASGNAYVCKECGKSHLCTPELCKESIITAQNEAQVCRITAKVVGGITAIADNFRPFHYHLDTTQQATKNTNIVTKTMKEVIKEHELIEQVMKDNLQKTKKNARAGRTTLRSISKKHLLPEVHDSKSNERCKKTFNAILDIVNDILRPPNLQDICNSNIYAYHRKGWENVEELIKTNNYNHLGDLINCYTSTTQHIIPHLMDVKRYNCLVDSDMTFYFASCIFHIFRIICGAHNVESMQGNKNLTFNDTVISLLYLLKTGYSGIICIATPDNIRKHLKSKKSRHPVIVLSNDTQDCGMPIATSESSNIHTLVTDHNLHANNMRTDTCDSSLHPQFQPQTQQSSPSSLSITSKHRYCIHKKIEFIPGHSVLDSVLLLPEFISCITISTKLSSSNTKSSKEKSRNHTTTAVRRSFNSSAKTTKSTIDSEYNVPNKKNSTLSKRKNRPKSIKYNEENNSHETDDVNGAYDNNNYGSDNDDNSSSGIRNNDLYDTDTRSDHSRLIKEPCDRYSKYIKTNDIRRVPNIISGTFNDKRIFNQRLVEEARNNIRNMKKPVVMSGDISVNKTYQSILNDPKNLQSEDSILKTTLGQYMVIRDDYR